MKNLDVLIFAQSAFAFGVAGLLWPEKFMPLFDVLMFPWPASYRTVRLNSVAAIGLAVLLAVRILATAYDPSPAIRPSLVPSPRMLRIGACGCRVAATALWCRRWSPYTAGPRHVRLMNSERE